LLYVKSSTSDAHLIDTTAFPRAIALPAAQPQFQIEHRD
jgi:hypothetical protein